jgi:NH3-dependent NAD+ synthetase
LDSILYLKLEKDMNEDEIVAWGIERTKVQKVLRMMRNSQHKRNPLPIPKTRTE